MNVRTLLSVYDPERNNEPDAITAADLRCIIGVDKQDGYVLMSMKTWKRLEFFIDILKTVDFTCYEEDIEAVLRTWRQNEQKAQSVTSGTGKSEVASTKSRTGRKNKKAGSLPDVFKTTSPAETTGASS